MRPVSIVRFEQAYLASILLWLVNLALGWKTRVAAVETNPAFAGNPQMVELAQPMLIGASVFMLALWVLLWYFTAQRANVVTKWIIVVMFGFSALTVPFILNSFKVLGPLSASLSALGFVATALSVWMLFRPDARAWFAGPVAEEPVAQPPEL